MLEAVDRIHWHSYPQPSSDQQAVPNALRALAFDPAEGDSQRTYVALLDAVGRNHAGTYYPVVVPTIPFLGEIIEDGSARARRNALEVLVDLAWSFEPEPGFEMVDGGIGNTVELRAAVRSATAKLSDIIQRAAVRPENDPAMKQTAQQLLVLLAKWGLL